MIKRTKESTEQKRNIFQTGIILLLSGINIHLAASLEPWTKSWGLPALLLFYAAGTVICFLLAARFIQCAGPRLKVHSLLWGILMTTAYVLGCRMQLDGTALPRLADLPALLAQILCLSLFAAACIAPLLQKLSRLQECRTLQETSGSDVSVPALPSEDADIPEHEEVPRKRPFRRTWLFFSAAILACWIPVFLAYYPSVFAYDAEGQLYQVLAHDYSTHHPLLHTLFLGFFFELGKNLFDSCSTGMAVHSLIQMLLMAGTFGYALAFLRRKKVPAYLLVLLYLFYALFPTNSVLALSTTKDVLFSAFVLLHTLCLYQITDPACTPADKGSLCYLLWTILLLLFRNNALYALLLSIPAICLLLHRKAAKGSRLRRRYLILTLLALLLAGAGNTTLKSALHANSGSPREMLSIPLQQMARTRVTSEQSLSPDMRRTLNRYLPEEWVFSAYNPHLADPVKNRAVIHDDPAGLLKTWVRLGLEYPQIYLDAFLDNSIGYWFLEDRTHAQIYGLGAESGFGYLSTDNRTMPAGFEVEEHSYLPYLRAAMERIVSDNMYQKIPVLRILFAPAFYWWLLCLYMAAVIYSRQYRLLIPAVFLAAYYLTLLLSPTVLIRYMYPLVVTVPVLCCLLFRSGLLGGEQAADVRKHLTTPERQGENIQ